MGYDSDDYTGNNVTQSVSYSTVWTNCSTQKQSQEEFSLFREVEVFEGDQIYGKTKVTLEKFGSLLPIVHQNSWKKTEYSFKNEI